MVSVGVGGRDDGGGTVGVDVVVTRGVDGVEPPVVMPGVAEVSSGVVRAPVVEYAMYVVIDAVEEGTGLSVAVLAPVVVRCGWVETWPSGVIELADGVVAKCGVLSLDSVVMGAASPHALSITIPSVLLDGAVLASNTQHGGPDNTM